MSAATPDISSILSMLQNPGGGGAPDPTMGGPMGAAPPNGGGQDAVPALLQQAIDALHQAFSAETEPIDREMIGKALLAVQQILAQEQKDKDAALGGTGHRLLRRNR